MKNPRPIVYACAILIIAFALINTVHGEDVWEFENPTASNQFSDLLENLAEKIVTYAIPVIGAFLVFSGFQIVSARGNEQQLESAKRNLYWTVIGTAVVAGAWALAEAAIYFANALQDI